MTADQTVLQAALKIQIVLKDKVCGESYKTSARFY